MKASLDSPIPKTVALLGYGGLIPFVVLALAAWIPSAAPYGADYALLLYGGVILSFVGALHWSFAMTLEDLSSQERQRAFIWSVMPALLAWVALLLTPPAPGVLLIAGFLLHYWRDQAMFRRASIPAWYLPLRLRLTVVAALSLALGTAAEFR